MHVCREVLLVKYRPTVRRQHIAFSSIQVFESSMWWVSDPYQDSSEEAGVTLKICVGKHIEYVALNLPAMSQSPKRRICMRAG